MKPFSLEAALAGEPLIDLYNNEKCWLYKSNNGDRLIIEYEESSSEDYPQLEYVNVNTNLAVCYAMWEEPKVTLTLPCPLKQPRQEMWCIYKGCVHKHTVFTDGLVSILLASGCCFKAKEEAQEWLNAMRNNRV